MGQCRREMALAECARPRCSLNSVGIGVAAFRSDSNEAQDLHQQLYALNKKRRKIIHAGVEYGLRVKIFDSFGEDAFRGIITRS
jgi:hypothetical protein